jgi:hypothetical protein
MLGLDVGTEHPFCGYSRPGAALRFAYEVLVSKANCSTYQTRAWLWEVCLPLTVEGLPMKRLAILL